MNASVRVFIALVSAITLAQHNSQLNAAGPTSEDQQRGFWLSRGGNAYEAHINDKPLEAVVGTNEKEAIPFRVNTLSNFAGGAANFQIDPDLASYVQFYQENDSLIEPVTTMSAGGGQSQQFWLIVDSAGLAAANHQGNLTFSIGAQQVQVPVNIRKYSVPLPPQQKIDVKGFFDIRKFSSGNADFDMGSTGIARMDNTIPYFAQMGGSVLDWAVAAASTVNPFVLVVGTGQSIPDVAPLNINDLPDLDFSYFDPMMDRFVANGVKRFDLRVGNISPSGNDPLNFQSVINQTLGSGSGVTLGSAQANQLFVWYYGQLRQYVENRGFTELNAKIDDEIGPSEIDEYQYTADLIRQAGWSPYSTMTGQIPRDAGLINDLNPQTDTWMIQRTAIDSFVDLINSSGETTHHNHVINGPWAKYTNGGAVDTWATSFFGTQIPEGSAQSNMEIFENDVPLVLINDQSPWGNDENGVAFVLPPSPSIWLSPTISGENPNTSGQVYRVEFDEIPAATIDPEDAFEIYGGGSVPWARPVYENLKFGWQAARLGAEGMGIWNYWRWGGEQMVFYDEVTGVTTLTPSYWGTLDGWQSGEYLTLLLEWLNAAGQDTAQALIPIISTDPTAALHLSWNNPGSQDYLAIDNREDPTAFLNAKEIVLQLLAQLIIPGDADLDGDVDLADYDIMSGNMYQDVVGGAVDGDFDGNGVVDFSDFATLALHFGMSINETPPLELPEPVSMGWLFLALIGTTRLSRRTAHALCVQRREQN